MDGLNKRIEESMRLRGISQADLCRMTEMGSSKISYILQGKTTDPRLSTVVRIADALDVSLDYLAGRREDPAPRLTHDESVLVSDYRECTPDRRRKVAEAVRDQRVLSQGQEAVGESSDDEQPESMNMLDFLMQSAKKDSEEGAA